MEVHFSSNMASCICHIKRNICDNFTLRIRDEESGGAYSDLDLETNGSNPDFKPLPSEEMHSFGQDIDISDILARNNIHVITWSARPGFWGPRMLIRGDFF